MHNQLNPQDAYASLWAMGGNLLAYAVGTISPAGAVEIVFYGALSAATGIVVRHATTWLINQFKNKNNNKPQ
jgi:hypothetical protein